MDLDVSHVHKLQIITEGKQPEWVKGSEVMQ